MTAVAAPFVAEATAVSAPGTRTEAPSPAAGEAEVVREFRPAEPTAPSAQAPGAGYAPAVPIRIEWPSDLQQVESDPEKVRAAQMTLSEPDRTEPVRPRRVRPPRAPVSEEPLVQVETVSAAGMASAPPEQKSPT
jgi:ribonuclease E